MRENGALPAPAGGSDDLRKRGLADPPGDPSVTSPLPEDHDFSQAADFMRSFPRAGDGEGLERTRIGRYRIERVLGAGGMGIVLLARDPASDQPVAIKLIRPECRAEPHMVRGFLREAHHMARMEHPNVVPIREISEQVDAPFYVMPYFARGSLSRRIDRDLARDPSEVPALARQIADALRYAHGLGIIHRDVKPSNILIADDGRACLADFGLVRTVFNDTISTDARNWCVGTPAYMSPAVAAGQPEDTRCDIYSFGAVLYALLTGVPPYGGGGKAVLDKILAGPPTPITVLNPAAPAHLISIAEGAMARELRDRYACMDDVLGDLDRVAAGRAPLGPHGARTGARRPTASDDVDTDPDATVASTSDPAAPRRRLHRSPFIARLALGMAALAMALALYSFHIIDRPPIRDLPVPGAPTEGPPLAINVLSVLIYPDENGGEGRPISATWPFAHSKNVARVEADLSAPAHCCLLELQPRGVVERTYPPPTGGGVAANSPVAAMSLSLPPDDVGFYSLHQDGAGLAAYVLVAWRGPRKVSPDALRSLAQEIWHGETPAKDPASTAWEYDGALFLRLGRERGQVVHGPDPPEAFARTCRALRAYPGIEAIHAVAFPIRRDTTPDRP